MMKIHIMHTGQVHVSPFLPFGGDKCNLIKASGILIPQNRWLWLPVSVYLIEHPKGLILFDTGWSRKMSPDGLYNKKAQIRSLGSYFLYWTNQGVLPAGQAACEQLKQMGIKSTDIDMILPGISADKVLQRKSLAWVRMESEFPDCMGVFANHDADVKPGVIELL